MRPWRTSALAVTTLAAALSAASTGLGTAARPPAGYNFEAEVAARLAVNWREASGSSTEPCASWSSAAGRSIIVVDGNVSGHIDFSRAGANRARSWADFTGLGKVNSKASSSNRRLNETGGVTACGNVAARTTPQPPNDCEKPGPRQYRRIAGQLSLRPARRQSLATLDDITASDSDGRLRVVVVDAVPFRDWYKRCRVSRLAPDLPVSLAIPVDDRDVAKLRTLKAGESYSFEGHSGVIACARPDVTGDREKCTGEIGVIVKVRRLR